MKRVEFETDAGRLRLIAYPESIGEAARAMDLLLYDMPPACAFQREPYAPSEEESSAYAVACGPVEFPPVPDESALPPQALADADDPTDATNFGSALGMEHAP